MGYEKCTNCKSRGVRYTLSGLCELCYNYEWRTGKSRPESLWSNSNAAVDGICTNCKQAKTKAKGLCGACYAMKWRTGKKRTRKFWSHKECCSNCKKPLPKKRGMASNGRCTNCRIYLSRTGVERPRHLWNAPIGFCECGSPATHKGVGLIVFTGDGFERTGFYDLCDSCFDLV